MEMALNNAHICFRDVGASDIEAKVDETALLLLVLFFRRSAIISFVDVGKVVMRSNGPAILGRSGIVHPFHRWISDRSQVESVRKGFICACFA